MLKNGAKVTETTYKTSKKSQVMKFSEVVKLAEHHEKQLKPNQKLVIRGLNIMQDMTLKGYNDDIMDENEYDEYARGKVKNFKKFSYFYSVTFSIREDPYDDKQSFFKI
jgi:hypothetical protein